jgi:hypothetical protein
MTTAFEIKLDQAPLTRADISAELSSCVSAGQVEVEIARKTARNKKVINSVIGFLPICSVWLFGSEISSQIFWSCLMVFFIVSSVGFQNQYVTDKEKEVADRRKKFDELALSANLNTRLLELCQRHTIINRYVSAVSAQGRQLIKGEFYAFVHFDDDQSRSFSSSDDLTLNTVIDPAPHTAKRKVLL